MENDELKCIVCNENYNETSKIPRILISCGHTYCQECLSNIFVKGEMKSIQCPEDKISYNMQNIEELPKNIALLKLLNKKKLVSFPSTKLINTTLLQTPPNIQNPACGLSFMASDASRNSTSSKIDDKYESIRKKSFRKSLSVFTNKEEKDDKKVVEQVTVKTAELCQFHKRPLEVVCVDDRVKICTNCALFGEHKSHDIRNEEDVFLEICTKAEILLESFQIIDFSLEGYDKREQVEKLEHIYNEKFNSLLLKIDNYYKDFKRIIKERRDKITLDLKEKFTTIITKVNDFKKFPPYLERKIDTWRQKVKGKLDIISEMTDKSEIDYELLGKKAEEQQIDLISESEEFIKEIDNLKGQNTDEMEKFITNHDIEWNKANVEFENFCSIIDKNKENYKSDNIMEYNTKNPFAMKLNNINDNVLNFNEQSDFEPRISIIQMSNNERVDPKPFVKTPVSAKKTSGRKLSDYNTEKSATKKPVISLYQQEMTLSQASISTKANDKLDNSFFTINTQGSGVLNTSQDFALNNKSKIGASVKKGKLTNDKIVFIKNQFKNENASFNCYDIGDEGAKVVAELISAKNCKVKDLKLTKTNIGDEGAMVIFKALESNSSISSFNISKNLLSDIAIDSILNCLKNNKIVKICNFSSNLFTSQGKEKIKSSARTNVKITL